ncbi:MAG: tRNA (adenosine(37)-N6)-dimethylallyltransferase MiaA [Ardenticatenia bacterium]|nr:tRNA (adenosine(37)-N6)-dimethylallyltransferase MiaA [Ardenticatenia bacterium]
MGTPIEHQRQNWERAHGPPLIVIVGPTGVGKTAVAVELAEALDGEIISADSRQLYRGMDIGTAKPTPEELARVRHHMVDVLDPHETMTVAEYQQMAYTAIGDLHRRGKVPFLVGGTGLYVRAVVEGFTIPRVPPDPALRARLARRAKREGVHVLHAELAAVDPEAANKIDPRNVRRVIRALEVYAKTGRPISELQRRRPPPYRILQIGLTRERAALYRRCDERIRRMIAAGLVQEVEHLVAQGYTPETCEAMTGLGYPETVAYLRGELPSLDELARAIGRSTRRFIRHQYGWFRLNDPRIIWFDLDHTDVTTIRELVATWLSTPPEETGHSQGIRPPARAEHREMGARHG